MSTGVFSSPKPVEARLPGCRFCQQLAVSGNSRADWTVIAETEHLVAVPSVGALVPGWLLVLPKKHHLNFAETVRGNSHIESELESMAVRWESLYGPLTWFEHGPKEAGSEVGCSIDHAHMHLAPLGEINLLHAAEDSPEGIYFKEVEELKEVGQAIDSNQSYLYIRLPNSTHWLAGSNRIPSQSLRRVIAARQGRYEEWDWKQFPRHDLLRETIRQATSLR
jgi:ATP adenylyltransferase